MLICQECKEEFDDKDAAIEHVKEVHADKCDEKLQDYVEDSIDDAYDELFD
jgi:hypothetical protein